MRKGSLILSCIIGCVCMSCGDDPAVPTGKDDPNQNDPGSVAVVSGDSFIAGVFESEFCITIKQNTPYDVQVSDDWIHLIDSRAYTTDKLSFKIDFNKTREDRIATISFIKKDDGNRSTVEVRQRGGVWLTCSLSGSVSKKSWEITDTIGVYGDSQRNVPFVYCDGNRFVADIDSNITSISSAYYPYTSIPPTEITDSEIADCLISDESLMFEPVSYPLTLTVGDKANGATCRMVSDSKIFGPWTFVDGKIEGSSFDVEKEVAAGKCSIPVVAKAKGTLGVIVKNDNHVMADNCNIEMDAATNVFPDFGKNYEALDAESSANCYIIDKKGSYCFSLRDAAGGQRWTGFDCYAEMIWADYAKDFILNPMVIGDMVFFDADMSASKQGNAGLALKNGHGKVLWSWHLWLTDQTDFRTVEKGKLLNIPLGSITRSRNFQYGDHYHAMVYQYGRKDPFPNQGPESEYLAITDEGLNAYDNCGGFGTFYRRDWHKGTFNESCPTVAAESDNGLFGYSNEQPANIAWNVIDWDDVNSPCPPGFSVPKGNVVWKYMTGKDGGYAAFPGLKLENLTAVEAFNNGLLNKTEDYWFPAIKDRTALYGIENQYHPYCGIPADHSIYLWIKLTETNAGGYHYARVVSWKPDDMGGIEIDSWAWGNYMPVVCVKD